MSYFRDGFGDGYQASFDTDWRPGEMEEKYRQDDLGEVVGMILENWQQMAGTIYYDDVGDKNLDRFEEGFYKGFVKGVNEQMKKKKKSKENPKRRKKSRRKK